MKFAKCYTVPSPQEIFESYETISEDRIVSNIEVENIKKIMREFVQILEQPIFFFLEIPCSKQEEEKLNTTKFVAFHKKVYYLDFCPVNLANDILTNDLEILLNCGMCEFGFGSMNRDEIYVCRYNIVNFFSENNIDKYKALLEKHNINQTDKIVTVWNKIGQNNPAQTTSTEINGKTCCDLMQKYFENGMYLGKVEKA